MLTRNSVIILKTSIILYALTMTFCNTQDTAFTKDEDVSNFLKDKHNAILFSECNDEFSGEALSVLFEKPVVMDTVIVAARKFGNEYRLGTHIRIKNNSRISAELKCTREIFEQYLNSKCTLFIVAATITQIDNMHVSADLFTIDEEEIIFSAGKEVFLAGSCIELIESPIQRELLNKNLN